MRPGLNAPENEYMRQQFVRTALASMRPGLNAPENRCDTLHSGAATAASMRPGLNAPENKLRAPVSSLEEMLQ